MGLTSATRHCSATTPPPDATLPGFTSQAQGRPGKYAGIDFTSADWSGATFSGPHDYTGSTCTNGSVAGSGDSCCWAPTLFPAAPGRDLSLRLLRMGRVVLRAQLTGT
ncbi:MAG: hypothetical protein IT195_08470 [Microthrixaceae bacterium]|nr:hypothetical protein [Microthrixaceae bacterium]